MIDVADAYGDDLSSSSIAPARSRSVTSHSGGWYDIALTTPSDTSFSYQLAGRLESRAPLTSDPQFARS